jgi:hypothetical protein
VRCDRTCLKKIWRILNKSCCEKLYQVNLLSPVTSTPRFPGMKSSFRRLCAWSFLMVLPFVTGCSEEDEKIAALKDGLVVTREANNAGTIELQQLNQKLSLLSQQVRGQHGQRMEFEAKAQKSGSAEKLLVKYRTELEGSLKQFTDSVAAYRKQYLTP